MTKPKVSPIAPPDKSPEMEVRDLTEAELQALGQVDIPPLTAPYDPSRDDDQDDDPPRAAKVYTPTLADMNARFLGVLEAMEQRQAAGDVTSNTQLAASMQLIAEAMNGFRAAQLEGAQTVADMQRRTVMPENKFFPGISAFNPRGDKDFPRPLLKCPMHLPWPADPDSLLREELELLNLLVQGTYAIRRVDRSVVKVTVLITTKLDSDEPSLLTISHDTAFDNNNHRLLPYDWLRQMCLSHPDLREKAKAILTTDDEEALIAAHRFNDGRLAEGRQSVVSVGE